MALRARGVSLLLMYDAIILRNTCSLFSFPQYPILSFLGGFLSEGWWKLSFDALRMLEGISPACVGIGTLMMLKFLIS